MLYFFEKKNRKNIRSVEGSASQTPVGLRQLGALPPHPQVVTLVTCSIASKLRPIISYLNGG